MHISIFTSSFPFFLRSFLSLAIATSGARRAIASSQHVRSQRVRSQLGSSQRLRSQRVGSQRDCSQLGSLHLGSSQLGTFRSIRGRVHTHATLRTGLLLSQKTAGFRLLGNTAGGNIGDTAGGNGEAQSAGPLDSSL